MKSSSLVFTNEVEDVPGRAFCLEADDVVVTVDMKSMQIVQVFAWVPTFQDHLEVTEFVLSEKGKHLYLHYKAEILEQIEDEEREKASGF